MIHYKNRIVIEKPQKTIFDYLTIPLYWASYLPCTVDVKPIVETELMVNNQVTEFLNVLGIKVKIQWTCTENDTLNNFVIDGKCKNFGGSTSQLSYKLLEKEGKTEVVRNIIFKQNSLIMRITEPILKLFFIFEAKVGLRKAKSIIESNS